MRSNDDRCSAGVLRDRAAIAREHGTGEQFGAFGCATYQVPQAPDYSFYFGGDVGALLKPPEVRVHSHDHPVQPSGDSRDPTAILSTGALGTVANPVSGRAGLWGRAGRRVSKPLRAG